MSAGGDAVERHQLTETSLGALAEYITSGSRDWSKYYADSGAIFIRTQDINQNRLSLEDVAYVQLPAKVEGKRSLVRKGDLLITITGANVGRVAVVEQELPEAYVSQSVCLVRPKDPSLAKFLQLQLIARRGEKSALEAMAYGLGRPVLNLENVRAAPVTIGPPRIRADIVAEIEKQFSRLDEAVTSLKRVKDRLDGYKGSIISEALGGRATADDGIAPNGWRRDRLGDAAAKITSGSRDWSPYYGRGAAIFLLAQNVRPMSPDFSVVQHVDPPEADPARARSRVQRGDLLVTIVGANTGQACMVGELPGETFVCQSVALVRPVLAASAPYLNLWLNSPVHGRRYFDRCMYGQGRPHLGFDQLASMPIAIPPPHEQARIVAEVDRRLSIVREVGAEVDANLKRAQALREAVLASTFCGTGG